ncbi:hypothetical protein ACFYXJ_07845 [Streptomyces sp. NPDC002667]|uniref:hypothetical protein n=1 Tax=Streptomyces sp. NPDC002667 TaxID=3364657 RepID=UPI00368826CA
MSHGQQFLKWQCQDHAQTMFGFVELSQRGLSYGCLKVDLCQLVFLGNMLHVPIPSHHIDEAELEPSPAAPARCSSCGPGLRVLGGCGPAGGGSAMAAARVMAAVSNISVRTGSSWTKRAGNRRVSWCPLGEGWAG